MISLSPPGSDVPDELSDSTSTLASSEGCSCSANVAARPKRPGVPAEPAAPGFAVIRTFIVPVKEFAPAAVFAARLTASSAAPEAGADAPPEALGPPAAAPEPAPAWQPVMTVAAITLSPAAYNGKRTAATCTENLRRSDTGLCPGNRRRHRSAAPGAAKQTSRRRPAARALSAQDGKRSRGRHAIACGVWPAPRRRAAGQLDGPRLEGQ